MKPQMDRNYSAFVGTKKLTQGSVFQVATQVKQLLENDHEASVLIFDDETSAQIEIDFRGNKDAVLKRLSDDLGAIPEEKAGPGRPKLGVVSREIGLLPRHWEWLALQPGGASVTLRKLVEDAKKKNQKQDRVRQSQESTYKFMSVLAGDLPHFEEALRSFYAKQKDLFETLIASWPKDIQEHIKMLSAPVFEEA